MTVTPFQAYDDYAQTEVGSTVVIPVLANDVTGNGEGITVVTNGPGYGTVTVNADNTVTLDLTGCDTPDTASFDYYITDENGNISAATVHVDIVRLQANDDAAQVNAGGTVAVNVLANDLAPAGAVFNVYINTEPAHGTVRVNADKTVAYASDGTPGTFAFQYEITDQYYGDSEATVTVTVAGIRANDDAVNALTGGSVAVDVLANDVFPRNENIEPVIISEPDHGTATVQADGTIAYTNGGTSGPDSFEYSITDDYGDTATATVSVPTNFQALDDSAQVAPNGSVVIPVTDNDVFPAGDALTVVVSSSPAHGTATANPDGTIRYVADGTAGTEFIGYRLTDAAGNRSYAEVRVTVSPSVTAPSAATLDIAINGTVDTSDDIAFVDGTVPVTVTYHSPHQVGTAQVRIEIDSLNPEWDPSDSTSPEYIPTDHAVIVSGDTGDNPDGSSGGEIDSQSIVLALADGQSQEIEVKGLQTSDEENYVQIVGTLVEATPPEDGGQSQPPPQSDYGSTAPAQQSGDEYPGPDPSLVSAPVPPPVGKEIKLNAKSLDVIKVYVGNGDAAKLTNANDPAAADGVHGYIYNKDTPDAMVKDGLYRIPPRLGTDFAVEIKGKFADGKSVFISVLANANTVSAGKAEIQIQDKSYSVNSFELKKTDFGTTNANAEGGAGDYYWHSFVRGALFSNGLPILTSYANNSPSTISLPELRIGIFTTQKDGDAAINYKKLDPVKDFSNAALSQAFAVRAIPLTIIQSLNTNYKLGARAGILLNVYAVSDSAYDTAGNLENPNAKTAYDRYRSADLIGDAIQESVYQINL